MTGFWKNLVHQGQRTANITRILKRKSAAKNPMSDGVSNRDVNFRMMLQSRGAGRYGYVIGRPDLEEWGEPSVETFESLAEADDAGREAMKIAARQK
jgi:hypothetical protein